MNAEQELEFERDLEKFLGDSEFLFTAKGENGKWSLSEALLRLRDYTRLFVEKNNGGRSSQSAFLMVRDALIAEREIIPLRVDQEPEAPELTADSYQRMPAEQIRSKYRSDPAFREQVDGLIARGLI